MNIGIDTDGVLTDLYTYNYTLGKKEMKREPDNSMGYDVREMYKISKLKELFIGLRYFFPYCMKWPPREGAVDAIKHLNEEGHQLYEITARKFVTKRNLLGMYSRHLLFQWYKRYGMHFKEIILCSEEHSSEEKLAGCIRAGVKLMVEDKPEVVELLDKNNIRVLMFDAPYNREMKGKNVTRVYSWEDVEKYIKEMDESTERTL